MRPAIAAGSILFFLLAGHTILEVARDALFLARLPAEQLPFTYIAIAIAAWLAGMIDRALMRRFDERMIAMATLLVAAAGTALFRPLFLDGAMWVPHAFYVWTGLIATFAVAQLWRIAANLFTVGEAKRLYAWIAAGGSLGALAGAALASLLQRSMVDATDLLLVGAGILAFTGIAPRFFAGPTEPTSVARQPVEVEVERPATSQSNRSYQGQLLVIVALGAIVATLVDYVFKAEIAQAMPARDLGRFFGNFYVVLNLASLLAQLVIAPRVLRVFGTSRALVLLPLLVTIGAAATFGVGGLIAALALRGIDGSLRHSLHRSAIELLYLPLDKPVRDRAKTAVEAIGQRGGQALGSVAILGATMIGLGSQQIALAIVVLALAWAGFSFGVRRGYLDLFRANLRAGSLELDVEVPQLDLHSLESLMTSLNSDRDEEVLATLELLREYSRMRLVPALLLFHPSKAVVLRALELFTESGRTDIAPIARRLLARDDEEIRAAALHALAGTLTAEELRDELASERVPGARCALLVAVVARGLDTDGSARLELAQSMGQRADVCAPIVRAIRLGGVQELAPLLYEVAPSAEMPLRIEIARAFAALRDEEAIPILIGWLASHGIRRQVRDALTALGTPALNALERALTEDQWPRSVRVHLPRTIARFVEPRAARILVAHLDRETDGWVRYKMLRALRALGEALPELGIPDAKLATLARDNLERACRVLGWHLTVEEAHAQRPELRTRSGELLPVVLLEKEAQALDRAVRWIALAHPREDLGRILHALRHGDRKLRAEGRELITQLAPAPIAAVMDTLLDDAPDRQRFAAARSALGVAESPTYQKLLGELVVDESEAVRCIAAYHVGELNLSDLAEPLREAEKRAEGLSLEVVRRALDALGPLAVDHA